MDEHKPAGSKISNTEWGLVIGFCLLVDAAQYTLDLMLIGPITNPLIDIVMLLSLQFYFYMRGIKVSGKKLIAWIGTPALGFISLGVLSFWSIDVFVTMLLDKGEAAIKKIIPFAEKVDKTLNKVKDWKSKRGA